MWFPRCTNTGTLLQAVEEFETAYMPLQVSDSRQGGGFPFAVCGVHSPAQPGQGPPAEERPATIYFLARASSA